MKFPVQINLDELAKLLDFVVAIDDAKHVTDTPEYVISDGAAIFKVPETKTWMRGRRWIRRHYDVFFDDYWEPTPKARKIVVSDPRIYLCPMPRCSRRTVGTPAAGGERWRPCPQCIAHEMAWRKQGKLPVWDRPSRAPEAFSCVIAPWKDALGGDVFKIHPKLESIIRAHSTLRLSR